MLKVGINGFGRIGRAISRINLKSNLFELVAINDINPDNKNLAYMLKYDTTYGTLEKDVDSTDESIIIDGKKIAVYHEKRIEDVDWNKQEIDILIDSSGVYENLINASKLKKQGIKHCIVTNAPNPRNYDKAIVFGVNEDELEKDHFVISSSICDAIAFSPTIHLLQNKFGIDHGFLTTLHPWLSYQNVLDGPCESVSYPGEIHYHYALGRACLPSLIPKPTSCIDASCKVLDYLDKKFMSFSFRVPTAVVSTADISVCLNKSTTVEEVKDLFEKAQKNQKWKVFDNNLEPLVSSDFKASGYSAVIDHRWTMVNNSNYLKLVLWYDNEWGYSSRVVDVVKLIEKKKFKY